MQPIDGGYELTHNLRWKITLDRIVPYFQNASKVSLLALGTDGQFEENLKAKFSHLEIKISDWDLRYKFPTENESYEYITSFEVLEHLKDQQNEMEDVASHYFTGMMNFLCESNRTLKQDGLIVLTTPNISSYDAIGRLLRGQSPFIYWPHVRELAPFEVTYFLDKAGFEVLSIDSFSPYTTDLQNSRLWTFLGPMLQTIEKLTRLILKPQNEMNKLRASTLFIVAKRVREPEEVLLETEWYQIKRSEL